MAAVSASNSPAGFELVSQPRVNASAQTARRLSHRVASLAFCLLAIPLVALGEEKFSAPAVKAAFVVNFVSFVEWPANTNPPTVAEIVIGAYGSENVVKALIVAARQSEGQPCKISVRKVTSAAQAARCQLVFIAGDQNPAPLLAALRKLPVLTVSDAPQFAEQGGMIGFVVVDQNLRFDINPEAGQEAGLKISSKVLSLARRVVRTERKAAP